MLTKEWGLLASKSFLAGLDIVVDSNPIVQQLRERRKANVRCFQITGKKTWFSRLEVERGMNPSSKSESSTLKIK